MPSNPADKPHTCVRLEPFNRLLLIQNQDTLFEQGLITFAGDSVIRMSERLSTEDAAQTVRAHPLCLAYHRNHVFQGIGPNSV